MSKSVIRADLAKEIYQQIGLSRNDSAEIVSSILDEISTVLERGETVKISSFGSLIVRAKKSRMGRNPRTGKEAPISSRRVLLFRPSHILRNRLNNK